MTLFYGYADPAEQAWMLLDENRVSLYRQAIYETVKSGDVVIDVGSGSGILAVFAARAGAKKVYAIERTEMAELLQENIEANGLADVIEVKRVDVLSLTKKDFPMLPNVVIGEMLGNFVPDENQHRLYGYLRNLLGANALWNPTHFAAPEALQEIVLRMAVHHEKREAVALFSREVMGVILNMTGGRCAAGEAGRPKVSPVISLYSFLLNKTETSARVEVDGVELLATSSN